MYLICCTCDNRNFTRILLDHPEYKYGSQLPLTTYAPLFFADQNWKNPRRKEYITTVAQLRPYIGTVLDLEREEQFSEVLDWAYEISPYVEKIVIIPKVNGIIAKLPRRINDKDVILGYSVPTEYAGTTVPIPEFQGWDVHLLGGNPHQQVYYSKQMSVFSVDCNFHLKMANRFCQYFSNMPNWLWKNPNWPTLLEGDGKKWEGNGRMEAFRRSCKSIADFWRFHGFRITV